MNKILMIDKVNLLDNNFLDEVCSEKYKIGKTTDKYWIFRSQSSVADNGTNDVHIFNNLCNQSFIRGFTDIMVTKNPFSVN